jgi:hypothetical protein
MVTIGDVRAKLPSAGADVSTGHDQLVDLKHRIGTC